jgi:conjugal transfer ATP-binding protein TraC
MRRQAGHSESLPRPSQPVTIELKVGPVRLLRRAPAVLWDGATDAVVFRSGALGFAGASEPDRVRWINAFRRLLDGLDAPMQVVIDVEPGAGSEPDPYRLSVDLNDTRSADIWFADQVARSPGAHRCTVSIATAAPEASRLEAALREMGVTYTSSVGPMDPVFGTEQASHFLHSPGWSRTWYVDRLPGAELEPGWLHRLLPRGLKVSLAWHATPLPVAWIVDYLQRQLVGMRATRMQELGAGTADPVLAGALPNAEDLQRRLTASQEKAFHVSVYLTLTSPTRESLDAGALKIEAAARAVLCQIQPCTFRMFDAYLSTRPSAVDRLQRNRVLDTSSLATFFPWLDAELQQPGGLVIGRSQATGSAVAVDPFDQQRYANANIGVFGHSGAGKTYLLSAIAMGALGLGIQVYVIDPEHEYGELAKQLGGVDVSLALGSGHALNVLELRPSDRRDESWIGPATADAVDLCATICGGLDERERALVETAVRCAYRDADPPLLRDVAASLPEESRVAAILKRWVHGSLGKMFSAPTNIDLEAPIVAFGMRELRDEMVAPVHFLLAEALWTRIKRKDRRRMLVVDELGLLFEDPTIRRFVVSLARRIRKYDGSLVFATQNPGDLLSSDQGAVVATNPAVLFFGVQRPGEAAKLERTFNLSPQQRAFLETARRGDFLLAAGAERLAVAIQAPPWQEEAMRAARDRARPPPRTGRLICRSAASPPLPIARPTPEAPRARPRAVRSSRSCQDLALRHALGRERTLDRPLRDGVLSAPAYRGPRESQCGRFREDGRRRDRCPDHHDLHA